MRTMVPASMKNAPSDGACFACDSAVKATGAGSKDDADQDPLLLVEPQPGQDLFLFRASRAG